jgi:hypothetical protein
MGDLHGAMDAAEKAKGWCWAAFWSAIAIILFYVFMALMQLRPSFPFNSFS